MGDEARIVAYLAVLFFVFVALPVLYFFARKGWQIYESVQRIESALQGSEGGRGLVAQVETLRVKSHEHANDILALKMRVGSLEGDK